MHVALHNENEISLYTHIAFDSPSSYLDNDKWTNQNSIKYDEESSEELASYIENKIKSIRAAGFHGVALSASNSNSTRSSFTDGEAEINLISWPTATGSPGKKEFRVFLSSSSIFARGAFLPSSGINGISLYTMINFGESDNTMDNQNLQKLHFANNNIKTVIQISSFNAGDDPIMVANGVATLIDETGFGDLVWLRTKSSLSPSSSSSSLQLSLQHQKGDAANSENIIALFEELSYLDLPGQTMKSRLVVDMTSDDFDNSDTDEIVDEEILEECLAMGINKFVINEMKIEWFKTILENNGRKSLA